MENKQTKRYKNLKKCLGLINKDEEWDEISRELKKGAEKMEQEM